MAEDIEPGEKIAEETTAEEPQDEIMRLAMENGYNPEYDGDNKRSPAEYLAYGAERSRKLGSELSEIKSTLAGMQQQQTQFQHATATQGSESERRRLQAQLDQAWATGDRVALDAAQQGLMALGPVQNGHAQPAQNQTEPYEVQQFKQENSWFMADPDAQAVAIAATNRNRNLPIQEQLMKAREAVFKTFPKYAPAKAQAPVGEPSPTPPKKAKGVKLDKEQKEAAAVFEKMGLPKEAYAAAVERTTNA